jgi:serine/threonine protein kinase
MWSLGCVIAELFLGWPLYPGSSEYDQMRYIAQTQNLPPAGMLQQAAKTHRFFKQESTMLGTHHRQVYWRLKTPEEHERETGNRAKETRKYMFNSLADISQVNLPADFDHTQVDSLCEKQDRQEFADILRHMLQMDQDKRLSPHEGLLHSFIQMTHLADYCHSNYVRVAAAQMEVCYRNKMATPTTGNATAAVLLSSTPTASASQNGVVTSSSSSRNVRPLPTAPAVQQQQTATNVAMPASASAAAAMLQSQLQAAVTQAQQQMQQQQQQQQQQPLVDWRDCLTAAEYLSVCRQPFYQQFTTVLPYGKC